MSPQPQDWDDPYALPPRPLSPGVPPADTPGAAGYGGFQPGQDTSWGNWWRTPLPDAAFNPQITSSGAAGMGDSAQPETSTRMSGSFGGAGQALAKMPPPPASAAPNTAAPSPQASPATPLAPPSLPQRMPAPGGLQDAIKRDTDTLSQPAPTPGSNWAQRLGMAVLSMTKLAPYAQQIIHPAYTQQMAGRAATEKELDTLTKAQEAGQRGEWYQAQAEGQRQKPILRKDGSIYDPRTGTIVQPAIDPIQHKQQLMDLGIDEETAAAVAAGLKPGDVEKTQRIQYAGLPPAIQALYKPDPDGTVKVPTAIASKFVESVAPGHPSALLTPFDPARIQQLNQLLAKRFGVLNPSAEVPPAYQLPPGATQQDYENVERSLAGEESSKNTAANQAASKSLREETLALARQAAADRSTKMGVAERGEIAKIYSPVMDSAERFNVMSKNYEDAIKNHDQQAMLSLLYNHMGMTMGLQKGARMTQSLINEAIKSRPYLQGMVSKFDKDGYLSGVTLSPQQMQEMVSNAQGRFSEDAQKARNSAAYAGATDDGPKRTPSVSVQNYYKSISQGSAAKALQLMKQDGWSVE